MHAVGASNGDEIASALKSIAKERPQVLIATDTPLYGTASQRNYAVQGIDIEARRAMNYERPHIPEDDVHRIGRTGRADNAAPPVICSMLTSAFVRALLIPCTIY